MTTPRPAGDRREEHLCRCGCGQPSSRDFLPGHDQRAIHERIKKVGTVSDFLDWFDAHFKE
ncbi:hypothetical protein [Sinomonas sp. RB5]